MDRPHHHPGRRLRFGHSVGIFRRLGRGPVFREAEVEDFDLIAGGAHQVGRLDVPMNDALRVRRAESVRDLITDIRNLGCGESLTRHLGGEGGSFHVLHRDEVDALRLANLVDVSDIRVVDCGCRFRLTEETYPALLACGKLRRKDLERHDTVELGIARTVNFSIPPLPIDATIRYGPSWVSGESGILLRPRHRRASLYEIEPIAAARGRIQV